MRIRTRIWGEPKDAAEAQARLRRAVELGVDFVDTAEPMDREGSASGDREALHLIARPGHRDQGGWCAPDPRRGCRTARPQHLREACEASWKRLPDGAHDLYQFPPHRSEGAVEDSIGELDACRRRGQDPPPGGGEFHRAREFALRAR